MLKKGFLAIAITTTFILSSPLQLIAAKDSATTVDEVVTWWEKYGKYWEEVKDTKSSSTSNN